MPTKTGERPAFPCLACIREQGRPDNEWYTELAKIVVLHREVNSWEIWSLLRKREGQYRHGLIDKIIRIVEENAGFQIKVGKISETIHEYGVPLAEEEHSCRSKELM